MIYGYIRPLYDDDKCDNQLNIIPFQCETIYRELHGSPKKRTQLEEMLMALQADDIIVVERLFALADTTRHLVELLKLCEKDGVTIHFLKEGIQSSEILAFSLQDMMMHILQFQSDIVKQSTTLGLVQAKEQGKSIGRPKKSDNNIKKAISMYHSGNFTLLDIKNETGISKSTLYRYLEAAQNG
ncbi:recombinase family protein [Psychrobacillus sp.]|uniref:recombinase family protein n=1 Tax=Psychrobacillus sp. TaxID=1871623 RepID=UPI0028BDCB69|nr:recombinase family protein [Psychrobacillus sp.]